MGTQFRDTQVRPTELLTAQLLSLGGRREEYGERENLVPWDKAAPRCLSPPRLSPSPSSVELGPPPQPVPLYLGHGLSGRIATDGASPLGLAIQLPLRHLDHSVHHLEAGKKGKGRRVGRESAGE